MQFSRYGSRSRYSGYKRKRIGSGKGYQVKRRKGFKRYGYFQGSNRRYLSNQGRVSIPSYLTTSPQSVCVTLPYSEIVQITTIAGAANQYVWNGNNIFDPNNSGTGHQPFGYDQWCNFYERYSVYGSSINVEFISTSQTSPPDGYTCSTVLVPMADLTSGFTPEQASELPHAKHKIVNVYNVDGKKNALRGYCSTAKVMGVSNQTVDSDDAFSAATNTSPARQWYWTVICTNMLSNGSITYNIRIDMKFYVKFWRQSLFTSS